MPRLARLFLIVLALGLGGGPGVVHASAPLLELPAQMPAAERQRLEDIMRNAFAATRFAGEPYLTRPDVFEFLLDHPEFATHVSRAIGAARYRIWRKEDGLWLDDGWGVVGRFAVVHAEPGRRIMHAVGRFEQRFLPEIQGQAVVALEYAFRSEADGRAQVVPTAFGYVQLDSGLLFTVLARVGAPFIQKKADREAKWLLGTFARVSRDIAANPAEVYRKVSERPDVPRQELEEFRRLLGVP